jgi:hypothetical protein
MGGASSQAAGLNGVLVGLNMGGGEKVVGSQREEPRAARCWSWWLRRQFLFAAKRSTDSLYL